MEKRNQKNNIIFAIILFVIIGIVTYLVSIF